MRRADRQRRRRSSNAGLIWLLVFLVAVTVAAASALAMVLTGDEPGDLAASAGVGSPSPVASATGDASPTPEPTPSELPPVRVVSGGDVMGDRQVESYINAHGGDAVLAGIARFFRPADAAWVNLESPLTAVGSPWPGKDVTFQGSPALAPALGRAGLDVVTMANNHAADYGTAALIDTIKRVERAGVGVVGAGRNDADAWRPAIVESRHGATIGFLAWTDIIWPGYVAAGGPGVATARIDGGRMKTAIRRLAKRVDYVVVGFHWGVEYEHAPIAMQIDEARAAVDAGADLVIGHHPHVLQGVQLYRKRLIVYSLGDLVFDHYDRDTGESVLVDAVVGEKRLKATLTPVYASSGGIPAVVTGAEATAILTRMKQLSAALGTRLTIRGGRAYLQAGRL